MKKQYLLAIISLISFIAFSCTYEPMVEVPVEAPTDTISFAATVEPIFAAQGCTECHPSMAQPDLSVGNAYNSIMDGRVDLANPENSIIYAKPKQGEGHFKTYTGQQAVILLTWIEQGAVNN